MFDISPAALILVVAAGLFTVTAAIWDMRASRIPNKLTIPMFFAGWVYQLTLSVLYGWHHLGSAGLGFLVGFGILFILWFVGGGGGGDVKLMGALSVWLGFKLTLYVLFLSTILVMLSTLVVMLKNIYTHGMKRTKSKYLATGKTPKGQKPKVETREEKLGRRVMAYAGPVAVATWLVLLWHFPALNPEVRAGEQAHPAVRQSEAQP